LLVDPLAGSITGANGIYERLPLWLRGIVLRPNAAFVFVHVVVSEVRQSGRNEPGEPQLVLPELWWLWWRIRGVERGRSV